MGWVGPQWKKKVLVVQYTHVDANVRFYIFALYSRLFLYISEELLYHLNDTNV